MRFCRQHDRYFYKFAEFFQKILDRYVIVYAVIAKKGVGVYENGQ